MASLVIHICVAKKLNENLKLDEGQLLFGSIAPDLGKMISHSKIESHFIDDFNSDIPNMDAFLNKYYDYLYDPFVLGYFIHLYTDKIWWEIFMPTKFCGSNVKLLDGSLGPDDVDLWTELLYNDYTNLTKKLIDYYDLDFSYFDWCNPKYIIEEIEMDKLSYLTSKINNLIIVSDDSKTYIFDFNDIVNFVDMCSDVILKQICFMKK